jgi:hypothetical protein
MTALLRSSATTQEAYAAAKAAGDVELAKALEAHGVFVASAIRKAGQRLTEVVS